MTTPLVWSERVESAGVSGWHDCTEASALMVLVAGGFTAFPLGIYTPEERNALDAASTRAPNTGDLLPDVDGAVAKRYGVALHKLPITTSAALTAELSKPGRAYLLTGQLKFYPPDDPLRRHDPKYEGGHAVCVVPIGAGQVRWLDPLAPNRFAGDVIAASKATQFAWTGWEGRYLALDELADMPDTATAAEDDMTTTITIHPLPAGSRAFFPKGVVTPLYDALKPGGPVDEFVGRADRESPADCTATVTIERSPKAAPVGTFRRVNVAGKQPGLLAQKDTVRLDVAQPLTGGPTEDEIASRIHDATQSVAAAAQAQADKF